MSLPFSKPNRPRGSTIARRLMITATTLVALGTTASAQAMSILEQFSANGATTRMDVTLGFTGGPAPLVTHGPFFGAAIVSPAGPVTTITAGPFTEVPPVVAPGGKDIAYIEPKITFSYGAPFGTGEDELIFEVDATLSAETAFDGAMNPLDAVVNYVGEFAFFIDAMPLAPPGTLVGEMQFDPLRGLADYESLNISVSEFVPGAGASIIASTSARAGLATPVPNVQLFSDRLYQIYYEFDALVPHGIDPHFRTFDRIGFDYQFTPIPLPASFLLLAPALALLGRRRR